MPPVSEGAKLDGLGDDEHYDAQSRPHELERELDMTGYSTNDRRVFGFVSERLLDAWLITNNISYEELDIVYMEHQNWLHKGTQFLKRKFFPKKDD